MYAIACKILDLSKDAKANFRRSRLNLSYEIISLKLMSVKYKWYLSSICVKKFAFEFKLYCAYKFTHIKDFVLIMLNSKFIFKIFYGNFNVSVSYKLA